MSCRALNRVKNHATDEDIKMIRPSDKLYISTTHDLYFLFLRLNRACWTMARQCFRVLTFCYAMHSAKPPFTRHRVHFFRAPSSHFWKPRYHFVKRKEERKSRYFQRTVLKCCSTDSMQGVKMVPSFSLVSFS
jgi:hypothetical protein